MDDLLFNDWLFRRRHAKKTKEPVLKIKFSLSAGAASAAWMSEKEKKGPPLLWQGNRGLRGLIF
jgi:hypothetical protein